MKRIILSISVKKGERKKKDDFIQVSTHVFVGEASD